MARATREPPEPEPCTGSGFIGALVYYISTANGFWDGVWGVLQSIVWPAFFVYGVMDKLNIP